jgi:hypothetical protein
MNRLLLNMAIVVTVSSVVHSTPAATQVSPTTDKTARVRVTQEPEVERADPEFAIIRWTSNNPGGSPEHYAVVHYGAEPTKLNQMAKSPIRLNPGHSYTVFRVRINGLKPWTTYYYMMHSIEANGRDDGVKSTIKHFTTPR